MVMASSRNSHLGARGPGVQGRKTCGPWKPLGAVLDALRERHVAVVFSQKRQGSRIRTVDEELSVQVIGLVLDDCRGNAFPGEGERFSFAIERFDLDAPRPPNLATNTHHAQAALVHADCVLGAGGPAGTAFGPH